MKKIRLPRNLGDQIELEKINADLKAGEASLDWSAVEEASIDKLEILLADLDLVRDGEILDIENIPDILSPAILKILYRAASKPRRTSKKSPEATASGSARPEIWKSEAAQETGPAVEETKPTEEKPQTSSKSKPVKTFLEAPSPGVLRDKLEELVLLDLLGPAGGPEEELEEPSVRDRYLVGVLAPSRLQVEPDPEEHNDPEEHEKLETVEGGGLEEGSPDRVVLEKISLWPSSFGLSFCVENRASAIRVTPRWGHYEREKSEVKTTTSGNPKMIWKRQERGGKSKIIPLKPGPFSVWRPEPDDEPEVVVKGMVRRTLDNWTVTLFLVNGQQEPKKNRDSAWLFQPELVVESPDGSPIFQRRSMETLPGVIKSQDNNEERALAMLYRKQANFAAGHGVGVHPETLPGDNTCAFRLSTRVVPRFEVPRTEAPTLEEIPELAGLSLDMKELAETPAAGLVAKLAPLANAYESWIAVQQTMPENPETGLSEYRDTAKQVLENCARNLSRIREGIALVGKDENAARAFAFMNQGMWQQRIHTLVIEQNRQGKNVKLEEMDIPDNRSWRPFQLAFILLNLPSLVDLHHPDRSNTFKDREPEAVADLLWFPTGGGKTEAYLGLTAFTLAIRRLQGVVAGRSGENGVAVLMRYTLRLLTLQQFQRAAALICACEVIRREALKADDKVWGATPFRLGLWVGYRTTPNTTEQSHEAIKQDNGIYNQGSSLGGSGTPRQLSYCPWCGAELNYKPEPFSKGPGRTLIYCMDKLGKCPFSPKNAFQEGLPLLVVDEEIYRLLPSLLIATVDKFAQLPWNGATQMLFGQVDKKCPRHGFRSPDLEDSERHPPSNGWPGVKSEAHNPIGV